MSERSSMAGNMWLLQRVTGVGLVVLLGFHFAVEHFVVGAANVTAENTARRMSEGVIAADRMLFDIPLQLTIDIPGLLYQAIALLLLAFSVHHGMYGVYNILMEQDFSRRTERMLKYFFVVFSAALFVQGVLIFLAFTGG